MSRRRSHAKSSVSDWHLWTEVTRSVSPLRPHQAAAHLDQGSGASDKDPSARTWGPKTGTRHLHESQTLTRAVRTAPQTPPGRVIEPGMRRRLTRGHLPIDATIDLHGLRQHEAHAALCRFIAARHARGDRTLLVITGKGLKRDGGEGPQKGVLRSMLPVWLAEKSIAPMVAGWDASARAHGGEGAYYVRLKRAGK